MLAPSTRNIIYIASKKKTSQQTYSWFWRLTTLIIIIIMCLVLFNPCHAE